MNSLSYGKKLFLDSCLDSWLVEGLAITREYDDEEQTVFVELRTLKDGEPFSRFFTMEYSAIQTDIEGVEEYIDLQVQTFFDDTGLRA